MKTAGGAVFKTKLFTLPRIWKEIQVGRSPAPFWPFPERKVCHVHRMRTGRMRALFGVCVCRSPSHECCMLCSQNLATVCSASTSRLPMCRKALVSRSGLRR